MPDMISTRKAYGQALVEVGRENPDVVVLDADLSKSTMTADFWKEFPSRFFNMGIAEQNMIATAAGLAACGKIPFASTFAIFASGRAWEISRMSLGYANTNVKIAGTHAGITVGEDGASHQANEDIAIMRTIPGFTVLVPCDGVETAKAVRAAVAYDGPVYLRLGRSDCPIITDANTPFEIGKATIVKEGTDVTIYACGIMVAEALAAAETLAADGINAEIVNVSSIKPLDAATIIASAKKTGAAVTAEEHSVIGGLGSAVSEVLCQEYPVPTKFVGMQDCFGESGSPNELLKKYGMTAVEIVAAAKNVVARKK